MVTQSCAEIWNNLQAYINDCRSLLMPVWTRKRLSPKWWDGSSSGESVVFDAEPNPIDDQPIDHSTDLPWCGPIPRAIARERPETAWLVRLILNRSGTCPVPVPTGRAPVCSRFFLQYFTIY